jgi:hypothetical protein
MFKRDTNPELMVAWARAWTTLGSWQALNARLSRELAVSPTWGRQAPGLERHGARAQLTARATELRS